MKTKTIKILSSIVIVIFTFISVFEVLLVTVKYDCSQEVTVTSIFEPAIIVNNNYQFKQGEVTIPSQHRLIYGLPQVTLIWDNIYFMNESAFSGIKNLTTNGFSKLEEDNNVLDIYFDQGVAFFGHIVIHFDPITSWSNEDIIEVYRKINFDEEVYRITSRLNHYEDTYKPKLPLAKFYYRRKYDQEQIICDTWRADLINKIQMKRELAYPSHKTNLEKTDMLYYISDIDKFSRLSVYQSIDDFEKSLR